VKTEETQNTKVVEDFINFPTSDKTPDFNVIRETYDCRKLTVISDMFSGKVILTIDLEWFF
jgi:hypothetical protein